jgi:hypothetical protein
MYVADNSDYLVTAYTPEINTFVVILGDVDYSPEYHTMILPTTPTRPSFTVRDYVNVDWTFTIDNSNNILSIYSVRVTNEYYALPSFSV